MGQPEGTHSPQSPQPLLGSGFAWPGLSRIFWGNKKPRVGWLPLRNHNFTFRKGKLIVWYLQSHQDDWRNTQPEQCHISPRNTFKSFSDLKKKRAMNYQREFLWYAHICQWNLVKAHGLKCISQMFTLSISRSVIFISTFYAGKLSEGYRKECIYCYG